MSQFPILYKVLYYDDEPFIAFNTTMMDIMQQAIKTHEVENLVLFEPILRVLQQSLSNTVQEHYHDAIEDILEDIIDEQTEALSFNEIMKQLNSTQ